MGSNITAIILTKNEEINIKRCIESLEGLPERPARTTRLNVHIEMTAVDQAAITVEDMGFGELFPSSGKAWTHNISV